MPAPYDISGYTPLKPGTRIVVRQLCFATGRWVDGDHAKIARWTKRQGPRNGLPAGYEHVRFDDGGAIMLHCDSFRVIDNRAAA